MTTAELTQWEVARGRLDVTIAEQDKTIARLREELNDVRWKLDALVVQMTDVLFPDAALEDTRD